MKRARESDFGSGIAQNRLRETSAVKYKDTSFFAEGFIRSPPDDSGDSSDGFVEPFSQFMLSSLYTSPSDVQNAMRTRTYYSLPKIAEIASEARGNGLNPNIVIKENWVSISVIGANSLSTREVTMAKAKAKAKREQEDERMEDILVSEGTGEKGKPVNLKAEKVDGEEKEREVTKKKMKGKKEKEGEKEKEKGKKEKEKERGVALKRKLHNLSSQSVTLLAEGQEVSVFLRRVREGSVLLILNPEIQQGVSGKGFLLRVRRKSQLVVLGASRDYGHCESIDPKHGPCPNIVNCSKVKICEYHIALKLHAIGSKRMVLNDEYSPQTPLFSGGRKEQDYSRSTTYSVGGPHAARVMVRADGKLVDAAGGGGSGSGSSSSGGGDGGEIRIEGEGGEDDERIEKEKRAVAKAKKLKVKALIERQKQKELEKAKSPQAPINMGTGSRYIKRMQQEGEGELAVEEKWAKQQRERKSVTEVLRSGGSSKPLTHVHPNSRIFHKHTPPPPPLPPPQKTPKPKPSRSRTTSPSLRLRESRKDHAHEAESESDESGSDSGSESESDSDSDSLHFTFETAPPVAPSPLSPTAPNVLPKHLLPPPPHPLATTHPGLNESLSNVSSYFTAQPETASKLLIEIVRLYPAIASQVVSTISPLNKDLASLLKDYCSSCPRNLS